MITFVEGEYVLTVDGSRVGSFPTLDEALDVWREITYALAA